jgi:hypothetical protein
MIYTFHYTEADADGAFFMPLDPNDTIPTLTEDIEANSLHTARREWERLHGDSRIVTKISYPMNELEANGIQLGDGHPV